MSATFEVLRAAADARADASIHPERVQWWVLPIFARSLVDSPYREGKRESGKVRAPLQVDSPARAPRERENESENGDHRLTLEVQALRRREQAQEIVRHERAARTLSLPPARESYTLTSYLAEPRPEVVERIAGLQRVGHRAVLGAQFKVGKSTLSAALAQSLADGVPFLGHFDVNPPDGRVGIWNAEMDSLDQRDYLEGTGIRNTDGVVVWDLRGHRVDLMVDAHREAAVEWLRDNHVAYWILDPWAEVAAWSGFSVSSNEDIALLVQRVDQVALDAGVGELLIVHHAGWEGGRLKGATRLPEWADVLWGLEADPTSTIRTFSASGRGVDLRKGVVSRDEETRRLCFKDESVKAVKRDEAAQAALAYIREHPGTGRTRVYDEMDVSASRQASILDELIDAGEVLNDTPLSHSSKLRINPQPKAAI
jgi:hypothetical protein